MPRKKKAAEVIIISDEEQQIKQDSAQSPSHRRKRQKGSMADAHQATTNVDDLPDELLLYILRNICDKLSNLAKASRVSKRWKRLCDDSSLWQYLCAQSNYTPSQTQDKTNFDWKKLFIFRLTKTCIDCGKETRSELYGRIRVQLCDTCRENYLHVLPNQHFIPKSRAKNDYGLNDKELSTLVYGFCENPMDTRYDPMNLFWKKEIEQLAVKKFGSLEAMKKIRRDRMIDREMLRKS